MTDLSKIDFTKLRLPNWNEQQVSCKRGPLGLELCRFHYRFAHRSLGACFTWQYCGTPTWNELEVAKTYTDRVDAFIAEESARLAAEDEAANFVPVPWQDVEWLDNSGATVEFYDVLFGCFRERDLAKYGQGNPPDRYRADRRTFPAGYDPTKPRWVEVLSSQVQRLKDAGCAVAYHDDDTHDWARLSFITGCFGPLSRYAIDIHTLKPGVPLHVEPPKPERRQVTVEFDGKRWEGGLTEC